MTTPKYFFIDNWDGSLHEFETFRDAKKAAKEQTGVSIGIIKISDKKITHVPASGHTPA